MHGTFYECINLPTATLWGRRRLSRLFSRILDSSAFVTLFQQGTFLLDLQASLVHFAIGLVLAPIVGIPLGIAMGWNPANINGILEFVDRGEIPHKNGKSAAKTGNMQDAIGEWLAEKQAQGIE